MCGLKKISVVNVEQSDSKSESKSGLRSHPTSWFSFWVHRVERQWQAIAHSFLAVFAREDADVARVAEDQSIMTALRALGLYLAKVGFDPGRDFSVGQGKLLLNVDAYQHLQQVMEPEHFADIVTLAPDLLVCDTRAAMNALNSHLGVDFFENLRSTLLIRLPTLSDAAILGYSFRLIQGVNHRHPEIKGFDHWVKQVVHEAIDADHLRLIDQQYSGNYLEIEPEDGWVLLIDLLRAAGGQEDIHFYHTIDGVMATDDGKKLLSQLIAGPSVRVVDLV